MPFSCCLQSVARGLALPPRTTGGADARSRWVACNGDIMSSLHYVIAILAMMSILKVPLQAQETWRTVMP